MNTKAIFAMIGVCALVLTSAMVMVNANSIGRIFVGDEESTDAQIAPSDTTLTVEEAKAAAVNHTPGTVISVELENEDGYLVYGVTIDDGTTLYDVKIDAGNGDVLKVEDGNED
jgi:uncharacterized membrane protein YkoI